MKIFLVSRTDRIGWDDYDSFVVRAENRENALDVCNKRWGSFEKSNTTILEVLQDGEEEIILGSFNAG